MVNETPIDMVMKMKRSGASDQEINSDLTNRGFNQTQISEAMNQAQIKSGIEAPPPPPIRDQGDMQMSMLSEAPPPTGDYPTPEPMTGETMPPSMDQGYPQNQQYAGEPMSPEQYYDSRSTEESIEEIAEAIIDEKWQDVTSKIGDIGAWKEKVETEIESIKQEVMRIEERFDSMQRAIVGRIGEYDESIKNVGIEIKALEKVLQKIIEPLVDNVKELSKITAQLKKK